MGICKCSKKRVTSTFCFEHRVNVCEFCMVNNHPTCIVQPYLQWLEDSSFKSKCSFCQLNLSNEECVRLLCYHVFHWSCLNKYCSSLPSNTAPAGYSCPDCNIPIFPSTGTPSPIYTVLKKKLITTEWARIGLGLPIGQQVISNNVSRSSIDNQQSMNHNNTNSKTESQMIENTANLIQQTFDQKKNHNSNVFIHHDPQQTTDYELNQSIPVAVNNVNSYINNSINSTDYLHSNNFSSFNSTSRKIMGDSHVSSSTDRLILDIDDDKYHTRSPIDRLLRYVKFFNYKHNLSANQRSMIRITLAICFVIFVFYVMIRLGRNSSQDDPLLDPKFNPDLHFQDVDNFN